MADQFAGVEELPFERVEGHKEVKNAERSLVDDLSFSVSCRSLANFEDPRSLGTSK